MFVLTTVMRCVPPVSASEVFSWLALAVNFDMPSKYSCIRLIGCESLPWASTCTGEFTVELFVGVQIWSRKGSGQNSRRNSKACPRRRLVMC